MAFHHRPARSTQKPAHTARTPKPPRSRHHRETPPLFGNQAARELPCDRHATRRAGQADGRWSQAARAIQRVPTRKENGVARLVHADLAQNPFLLRDQLGFELTHLRLELRIALLDGRERAVHVLRRKVFARRRRRRRPGRRQGDAAQAQLGLVPPVLLRVEGDGPVLDDAGEVAAGCGGRVELGLALLEKGARKDSFCHPFSA